MLKHPRKMILNIEYHQYVMDEDIAIEMVRLLNRSNIERVANKWDPETKVSTNYLTPVTENVTLKLMPNGDYAILRLATASVQENNNG
jgi:hypothetical protein